MSLRPDIADHYVTVNGLKVRYIEKGTGTPLLCLHGLGPALSADQYLVAIDDFSKFARVVAMDMPGWGLSDMPASGYSFKFWMDTVKSFCDALHLQQVDVMGQSMGGWFATLYAYENPERVRRVVLIGNAGLNPPAVAQPGQPLTLPDRDALRANLYNEWRQFHPITDAMVDEQVRRMGTPPNRGQVGQQIRDYIMTPANREAASLRTRLPAMKQPILVVWGDNPTAIGLQWGIEAFNLAPNARLMVTHGGNHSAMGYTYDQFLPAAKAFLTAAEIPATKKLV